MRKDLHNNTKVVKAISPVAVGTTGAANGVLSGILDRKQDGDYYRSAEFLWGSGASATVADIVTPVIFESATTGGAFTSVADADLIGTEEAKTLAAGGVVGQVGYRGNKRYLKIKLYGIGTATALVDAKMLLGHPDIAPTN